MRVKLPAPGLENRFTRLFRSHAKLLAPQP